MHNIIVVAVHYARGFSNVSFYFLKSLVDDADNYIITAAARVCRASILYARGTMRVRLNIYRFAGTLVARVMTVKCDVISKWFMPVTCANWFPIDYLRDGFTLNRDFVVAWLSRYFRANFTPLRHVSLSQYLRVQFGLYVVRPIHIFSLVYLKFFKYFYFTRNERNAVTF